MKKTLYTFIFLFVVVPIFAIAKDTRKINNVTKNEKYNVLKNNKEILHGPYQRYSTPPRKLLIEGQYNNGTRDGIWTCYNRQGEISMQYDYTNNHVLLCNDIFALPDSTNKVKDITSPPVYLGGADIFSEEIADGLKLVPISFYESHYHEMSNGITVYVEFKIDKEGNMTDLKSVNPVPLIIEQQAIKVFESLSYKWLPSLSGDKLVESYMVKPITFRFVVNF